VPSASAFVAVYGMAEDAYNKLFVGCTQVDIERLYRMLDFNAKGYADLYDFTREAQLNLGGSIKPQHLYLAIRRMSSAGNGRVTVSDMLKKLKGTSLDSSSCEMPSAKPSNPPPKQH